MQPLAGIKVLDFSTTLPGPLATLILAEAGATVIKVERRDGGDPGRFNKPQIDGESLQFAMLNKGKRSLAVDLKNSEDSGTIRRLVTETDILVEQFRPGVMERLGFGYEALSKINRRLIYCSVTGYGQTGPLSTRAGHDLSYLARNGVLSLGGGTNGEPILPPALIADIGGGTYPAIINILLALVQRSVTGRGAHLDVAMAEQGFPWISRQLAVTTAAQSAPLPGQSSHTGSTPRYGLHETSDGYYLAVAAIEEKFWQEFCDAIDLPQSLRRPDADIASVKQAIGTRVRAHGAQHWRSAFHERDCCVEIVVDLKQATSDPHFVARGLFDRKLKMANGEIVPALPVPIDKQFLSAHATGAPSLGEANGDTDRWKPKQSQ